MTHSRRCALAALTIIALSTITALAQQGPPRLQGMLVVRAPRGAARDRDVNIDVTLTNPTQQPAVLPEQVVSVAQLLLEVRDTRNQVVATMPPPTPSSATVTIAAGATIRRTMSLAMFSPALRPGRYTVRFRSPLIVGAAVTVTVTR